jgi:hypothetical protein
MIYITNRAKTIRLPYEPGLLEWLLEKYPYSKYTIIEE